MEANYIANFQRQLEIRRAIAWVILLLILVGFPAWFYIDSFLETASFGDKLDAERYLARTHDAMLVTLVLLLLTSALVVPALFFLNRFFNRYQNVIARLTPAEIVTLKTITDSSGPLNKYMPSFIITSQNLFVFAMQLYVIPFNLITSHKFSIQQLRNGFMYKVEINTRDGNYYNFNISSNPIQLEQLKLRLNSIGNLQ